MSLPPILEIVPPSLPIHAVISVPGSKSITNRALILAALSHGKTTLTGALWSEDTQVMTDCLRVLGFEVQVFQDPNEVSNRTIVVEGRGGEIPNRGTETAPLSLFVGNAGTAARFLAAMVCLGQGTYRLSGIPRMHERPQASLFESLRQLGYKIDSPNNKLPAAIHGRGPTQGRHCQVGIEESSQFASALHLSAGIGGWEVEVTGTNSDESPYVTMTEQMREAFPQRGGQFQIEPDASSGSYFWGADVTAPAGSSITVANWPSSGWQIDAAFPRFLPLPPTVSRQTDLGDSIMTAIVLAPFSPVPVRFTDLGRLRVQECERVQALRTELTKCGAQVTEIGDTLEIQPSHLHGAEIETYHDHRMAMCFAILGLKVPGIKINNPACVKKTFPDFFQKLALPGNAGLGIELRDARDGRKLTASECIA